MSLDVSIEVTGRGVAEWLERHLPDGGGSEHLVLASPQLAYIAPLFGGRIRGAQWPHGRCTFRLRADGEDAEFVNTAEVAQVALEQLAGLADRELLADADLTVNVRAWR